MRSGYKLRVSAEAFGPMPAYPIKQRMRVGDIDVVLLSVPPGANLPQNIYGLTEKGDVLWQIEPRPSATPDNKYTSIRDELGVIVADTEDRRRRKIDPKSGKVLTEESAG